MTLLDTIKAIEAAANDQPNVHGIVENDIFRLNTMPDAKYAVFGWTQQQHTLADDFHVFAFAFFYVDRLTEDKSNEAEVQSVGVSTLTNIIRTLEDDGIFPAGEVTFQTFNQQFLDDCAGVWCNVRLQVPAVDDVCADFYELN